ncbi:metallophosphoesterase family protein [Novosphingobium sp. Fuku2-ISO-50]|uniref:metallophosphoesterase family protein n=1 Tax=Novosphingobium sp. Fuku2-ISO-50 TaxID=1739114 RepID=UPI00076D8D89|nr:metallophosphoesterase family protein [Novosphingobium sp. Fuku2-ISO-50]KUR78909.1 serine/threonine protein phosphatase [Novosphingobium sp. Fuku2-ISO-50]
MLNKIRNLFAPQRAPESGSAISPSSVPANQRVYAIGDIHGRLDLFEMIIARIEQDDSARAPADTTVILLGDLVDRGPDSAGVIAAARDWARRRKVRFLSGNHEEMFLASFADEVTLRHFLRHGGRETLLSYPITPEEYGPVTLEELQVLMRERIPAEDIAFLESMEDLIRIGDYVFVHAGIRGGIALENQSRADLRWIRAEFLDDPTPRDFTVVHGHTITSEPELHPFRIGIDTGAFDSHRLTAIGLEGTERWLVVAEGPGANENAPA